MRQVWFRIAGSFKNQSLEVNPGLLDGRCSLIFQILTDGARMTHANPQFALVTGGAKRLGKAISLELARAGWSIVLHCRSSLAEARDTAAQIEALGVHCVVVQADLERGVNLDFNVEKN